MSNFRKLIAIMVALILIISMTACGDVEPVEQESFDRFKIIDKTHIQHPIYEDYDVNIVVDTETGVLYLLKTNGHATYMTVLLNTDGTPLIWEDYYD